MKQSQIKGEILSNREAAEFLGVNEGTLSNWRCSKAVEIPYVKVGRSVKYMRESLIEFLTAQEVRV